MFRNLLNHCLINLLICSTAIRRLQQAGHTITTDSLLSQVRGIQEGPATQMTRTKKINKLIKPYLFVIKGPLFVGQEYQLEREVVGLGESARTESMWIKTVIKDPETGDMLATTLLNSATLKQSYAHYTEDAQRLGKVIGH